MGMQRLLLVRPLMLLKQLQRRLPQQMHLRPAQRAAPVRLLTHRHHLRMRSLR